MEDGLGSGVRVTPYPLPRGMQFGIAVSILSLSLSCPLGNLINNISCPLRADAPDREQVGVERVGIIDGSVYVFGNADAGL